MLFLLHTYLSSSGFLVLRFIYWRLPWSPHLFNFCVFFGVFLKYWCPSRSFFLQQAQQVLLLRGRPRGRLIRCSVGCGIGVSSNIYICYYYLCLSSIYRQLNTLIIYIIFTFERYVDKQQLTSFKYIQMGYQHKTNELNVILRRGSKVNTEKINNISDFFTHKTCSYE